MQNSSQLDQQDRETLIKTTRNLLAELQSLSTRINAINEIATAINRTLDLDGILDLVGQQAKWLFDFDHCSVLLSFKNQPDSLKILHGSPISDELLDLIPTMPIGRAVATRQSQIKGEYADLPELWPYPSIITIPLESESEVLGTINFSSKTPNLYNFEDLRIGYLLALQLADAIRNARRFKEVNLLYEEIDQAYTDLQHAEEMRDELTMMVAHDLRNPLTIITNSAFLIKNLIGMPEHIEKVKEIIGRSESASKQMMRLIDDMMDISKFEAGELRPILKPINLTELVGEAQSLYQVQAESLQKNFSIKQPTTPVWVIADKGLLRRVLDNIVNNAFKHTTKHDQISVEIEDRGKMVQLSVRDSGKGIPEDQLNTIFDKFAQVKDASGKPLQKGTGLGLAFCKMAIDLHEGEIGVRSVPDEGSTFYFCLMAASPTYEG